MRSSICIWTGRDIAFRVGPLTTWYDRRRLKAARRKIVASPAYLDCHGTPRTVDDLSQHNCLSFNFAAWRRSQR